VVLLNVKLDCIFATSFEAAKGTDDVGIGHISGEVADVELVGDSSCPAASCRVV
jgi:hypothetical protein